MSHLSASSFPNSPPWAGIHCRAMVLLVFSWPKFWKTLSTTSSLASDWRDWRAARQSLRIILLLFVVFLFYEKIASLIARSSVYPQQKSVMRMLCLEQNPKRGRMFFFVQHLNRKFFSQFCESAYIYIYIYKLYRLSTGWDRSHGLPALSHVWQHVKLSDALSWGPVRDIT